MLATKGKRRRAKTSSQKAKNRYEGKRFIKRVSFNAKTEKELIDFTESINFSLWVKFKIYETLRIPCPFDYIDHDAVKANEEHDDLDEPNHYAELEDKES